MILASATQVVGIAGLCHHAWHGPTFRVVVLSLWEAEMPTSVQSQFWNHLPRQRAWTSLFSLSSLWLLCEQQERVDTADAGAGVVSLW